MENKPYFAKYLSVKGKGDSDCKWQWNNNIQNTGWEDISPSDMDAVIAHGLQPPPQFRKVKLFLCSKDIQIGDTLQAKDGSGSFKLQEPTRVGMKGIVIYPTGEEKEGSALHHQIESDYVKVIGEILTEGIVEGQEFTEKEIEYLTLKSDKCI